MKTLVFSLFSGSFLKDWKRRTAKPTRQKKLVSDADFLFLFRLAWTLKKSVQEVLALPQWERESWRALMGLFGPLDWRRDDLLFARVNQYQAIGGEPLKNFVLFRDPTEKEPKKTEEELLAALGYKE